MYTLENEGDYFIKWSLMILREVIKRCLKECVKD